MEKAPRTPKQIIIKGKSWTPEAIKEAIITNDKAVKAALLRIYSFQTMEEQDHEQTVESNGKGFNGTDAKILSSFSLQLKTKGWLSPKQIALSRKRLLKYSRQLFMYMVSERNALHSKFGI